MKKKGGHKIEDTENNKAFLQQLRHDNVEFHR